MSHQTEEIKPDGQEEYDPVEKPGDAKSHVTTVNTRKMYKEGGIVAHEDQKEQDLVIGIPVAGVPMAEVGAATRMTINMGNYETCQLEVSIRVPCYVEEIDDAYKCAKKIVDLHLNREVKAIREYRDQKARGTQHGDD